MSATKPSIDNSPLSGERPEPSRSGQRPGSCGQYFALRITNIACSPEAANHQYVEAPIAEDINGDALSIYFARGRI